MTRLSALGIEFAKNVGEDSTSILCTREELEGLDDSFVNELKKTGDKFVVTMQYSDLLPVFSLFVYLKRS
jgi:Zn-dependent oligopeptidase